jgi:hypothetical protein
MTTRTPKEPKGQGVNIGPEAHARALIMLIEGCSITYVAETLEISRPTVRRWRDSPEGQAEITKARKARADAHRDASEAALRTLRENADKAAQVLVDQLDDDDPAVASVAARTVLDRIGVPRTERIETQAAPMDLSKLSTEELEQWATLLAKVGHR